MVDTWAERRAATKEIDEGSDEEQRAKTEGDAAKFSGPKGGCTYLGRANLPGAAEERHRRR
jgi:hypothetical protein